MQETKEPSEEPFDISSVPREIKTQLLAEKKAMAGLGAPPSGLPSTVGAYEKLCSISEFSSFGKLFKSSAPLELTEAETEYAVNDSTLSSISMMGMLYSSTTKGTGECSEQLKVAHMPVVGSVHRQHQSHA
ncbi:Coatomer subunit gamma [Acorus calamus]|uniref:Coatomer subunit gamma n=1 Tax=Acorus calamus TaxID=4465 RepID=A0AAV9CGK8_ACOCL|nr:Coatomer subunit gamma [Acorus calamus]